MHERELKRQLELEKNYLIQKDEERPLCNADRQRLPHLELLTELTNWKKTCNNLFSRDLCQHKLNMFYSVKHTFQHLNGVYNTSIQQDNIIVFAFCDVNIWYRW